MEDNVHLDCAGMALLQQRCVEISEGKVDIEHNISDTDRYILCGIGRAIKAYVDQMDDKSNSLEFGFLKAMCLGAVGNMADKGEFTPTSNDSRNYLLQIIKQSGNDYAKGQIAKRLPAN